MAQVMHGRRAGQSREEELPPMNGHGLLNNGPHSAPAYSNMPGLRDIRQTTILSKNDWDRIQGQLNKRAWEEEQIHKAKEEKERLREMSKEQIKSWTNTIAGHRQKKLEARNLREEKEEEERKVIDIEEETFQAQKRKEAIERAKTQQYYQTDRVKGFHGALLLTEVLKEREAQLELNRLKEKALDCQDNAWLDKARKDYEEGILRDQQQASKQIKHLKETAKFQKAQVREHQKIVDREINEDQVEGEELKRLAAQYDLERKRLDTIRKQEAKVLMTDNLRQINDVHRIRDIQQMQEDEEDEECRIFAAAKRKMMKLRATKEKELHHEKQVRLEQIRGKLHAQMLQHLDDEDERIRLAKEEGEVKQAAEEAQKEMLNRKQQAEMVEHRHQQMRECEKQEREERKKELEMLAVRREADAQFQKNEEEKQKRILGDKKSLQRMHIEQRDEVTKVMEKARQEQLAQDRKNEQLLELEETQFQEYAGKVITHCKKGGRNVYPLQKAALEGTGGGQGPVFKGKGGVRPSYMVNDQSGVQMPNYQRGTTDEIKQQIYGKNNTNKRLGFVW